MIIPKIPLHKILFVGDDCFYGVGSPSTLGVSIDNVPYDKKTGLLSDGTPVDKVIINYINTHKRCAIMCVPQPAVEKVCNAEWIKYALKNKIPMAFVWYDAVCYTQYVEQMASHSLNIILDDQLYESKYPHNIIHTWTPIIISNHAPDEYRPIDVSFLGIVDCPQRIDTLKYLLNNGIHVFTAGNQPWNRVDYGMMCHYLRSSKITLNFSANRFVPKSTLKGRVIEGMLCGCLVLEDANNITEKYFVPEKEISWYHNPKDLKEKIQKLLKDNHERIRIAHNGQYRCMMDYSPSKWWSLILPKFIQQTPRLKM